MARQSMFAERERCNAILSAIEHIIEFDRKPATYKRLEAQCPYTVGQIYHSVRWLAKTNKLVIEKGEGREHTFRLITQPLLAPIQPPAGMEPHPGIPSERAGVGAAPEVKVPPNLADPASLVTVKVEPAPVLDEVKVLRADLSVACHVLEYLRPSCHALVWYDRLMKACVKG